MRVAAAATVIALFTASALAAPLPLTEGDDLSIAARTHNDGLVDSGLAAVERDGVAPGEKPHLGKRWETEKIYNVYAVDRLFPTPTNYISSQASQLASVLPIATPSAKALNICDPVPMEQPMKISVPSTVILDHQQTPVPLGSYLLGVFINSFLTGIMQVQTRRYYRVFPKDSLLVKLFVATLWLSQMTFFFLNSIAAYFYLVTSAKNPTLLQSPRGLRYLGNQQLIVTTLTHLFFASRLWSYRPEVLAMLPLIICIVATFAIGVANDIALTVDPIHGDSVASTLVTVWNVLIVATNLFISLYLVFVMTKQRSAVKSTNSVMNRIALYGVGTSVLSSVLAVFTLVTVNISWLAALLLVIPWSSAVMICVVLANLHMRTSLRARFPVDQSIELTTIRGPSGVDDERSITHPLNPSAFIALEAFAPLSLGETPEHQVGYTFQVDYDKTCGG
ncbi:hypothetical protein DL93DRAFT_2171198 [Clavulina sp. PMI_390]|nr:hypothetical protein DL93DRAFT_2171198 [Clavulina sp. PMI_390]